MDSNYVAKASKATAKMCCHMGTSADDIVSEACVELLEHKGLAERVYEKKEVSFLVSLLKRKLYEVDAKDASTIKWTILGIRKS